MQPKLELAGQTYAEPAGSRLSRDQQLAITGVRYREPCESVQHRPGSAVEIVMKISEIRFELLNFPARVSHIVIPHTHCA